MNRYVSLNGRFTGETSFLESKFLCPQVAGKAVR
jgi:hypothetical protein